MFKKIIKSRLLKLLFTVVLIYFAFRKVDISSIFKQLADINIFFIIIVLLISIISTILISYRWSLLLIKKPKISDVVIFAKSTWAASFYGLFVPTSLAGDVFKWVIIDEKYPNISKQKLLGSIFLDRFIGMTVFVFLGFIMQFFAFQKGIIIPFIIRLAFWVIFFGCVIVYLLILLIFGGKTNFFIKFKWFDKFKNIEELINKDNHRQIIKSILISLISDSFWISQTWLISQYFGSNLTFLQILIFLPVISTILILPISIGGFGAREQLYLYFFVSQITSAESVLLTSTFLGIIGILNSLWGGLVILTPDYRKKSKKLEQ